MTKFEPGHPATIPLGSPMPYGAQAARFKSIFTKQATPERIEKLAEEMWTALEEVEPLWDDANADANRIRWREYKANIRQHALHLLLGKDPQVLIQVNNTFNNSDKREKAIALLQAIGATGHLPVQAGGTCRTLVDQTGEQNRGD